MENCTIEKLQDIPREGTVIILITLHMIKQLKEHIYLTSTRYGSY